MLHSLIETASAWTIAMISSLGYGGVFIGMMIESASIPLPSEIIMGFAGYLVYKGQLNLYLVATVGALGNFTGGTIMYIIGSKGGRPVIDKYGAYLHITPQKMEKATKWISLYGEKIIFFIQLMPIMRTFISLPAGILRVSYPKFVLYTVSGAFLWCLFLASISNYLGENWEKLSSFIKEFEIVIVIAAVLAIGTFIYRKLLKRPQKGIEQTSA